MSMFTGFKILGSGLSAQRVRMNLTSSNLANAHTTRTEEGGAYRRKDPVFQAVPTAANRANDPLTSNLTEVNVSDIVPDDTPLPLVYDPSHPDAGPDGFVELPNVNIVEETVNMINASRSFEANAQAFETLRGMMQRAIDMGR